MNSPLNPYKPPRARISRNDAAEVVTRPRGLIITAIAVAFLTSVAAGIAPGVLKSYREMFAAFGAEFPALSQIALSGAWFWSVLAVSSIGVAIWVGHEPEIPRAMLHRMRVSVASLAAAFIIALVLTLVAIYLPLFALSSVV